jgi:uracil-DNA glycosylase
LPHIDPPHDCTICPRLVEFRRKNNGIYPDWHNGPVPVWGDASPRLVVIGLAPGLKGANRTGRPFTGDYAGDLLYRTLVKFGLATGTYDARPDDGLELAGVTIINAVRCVPPENKPSPAEIANCRRYLIAPIEEFKTVQVYLALGRIAHDSLLTALDEKRSAHKFAHGAMHQLPDNTVLFDSYHCSRYNTNTRVLTPEMFHRVFGDARKHLDMVG